VIHLKDNFQAGAPISQVPASWFNSVAKFINGLIPGKNVTFEHPGASSTAICAESTVSRDVGTPSDNGSFPTNEITQDEDVLWTVGGTDGVSVRVIYDCDTESGDHDLHAAKLTFSKDGILTKIETVANEGFSV